MEIQLDKEYKVLVLISTYNHVSYIEDALRGVIIQRTNFPILAIVLDDCSTDGTKDIIRKYEEKYPDLIKGIYFEENQYSKGRNTMHYVEPLLDKVKYVALCEGDDYWTDPLKLQKQCDLMEDSSTCLLSFHSVMEHWEDGCLEDKVFSNVEDRTYSGTEIYKQWIIATCTVFFRSSLIHNKDLISLKNNSRFMYYDIVLFLFCAAEGSIIGMSDIMGVYRRHNSGYTLQLWNDLEKSYENVWKICLHNAELDKIFSPKFGEEFKREAVFRFVTLAYYNAFKALKAYDVKHFIFFINKSFSYYPKMTLHLFWDSLKKKLGSL